LIRNSSDLIVAIPGGRLAVRRGGFDKAFDGVGERVAVDGGCVVSERGRRRTIGIRFLQDAVQSVVTRPAAARCSFPIVSTGRDAAGVDLGDGVAVVVVGGMQRVEL